jgi:hypothetical protein
VEHHEVLHAPLHVSKSIQNFLECPLDVPAMSRQIDESLYRQRIPSADVPRPV